MKYYQDIHVRGDGMTGPSVVLDLLFNRLHLALADRQESGIGVSFPEAGGQDLGNCLRLHGSKDALERLGLQWQGFLASRASTGPVRPVPAEIKGHVVVSRAQVKAGLASIRRRFARRHTPEEAAHYRPQAKKVDLPSIEMRSGSTGQHFRLFIRQQAAVANAGTFSAYGLSRTATVPFF